MKLAFHSATTMSSDLGTDLSVSANAGYKALEVWTRKIDEYLLGHTLEELRTLFSSSGIQPLAMNSIEFIAFRKDGFREIQDRLHGLCLIAQAIGCPMVILVPSPLPDRQMTWSEVKNEYIGVLRDLCGIAIKHQIQLSFEPLGFGWSSVRTPRAAFEIIRAVDRENLGLTFDAAHFYGGGGLMSEIDQLDPQRIFAFHLDDLEDTPKEVISDATRLLPGLGVVPLNEICARLKNIGYDGPCAIELFRPEYWQWDPLELAVKARQAALNVLTPYFQVE